MHRIGVLALQGGYALHQRACESLGVKTVLVYKPSELQHLDALIIPGGESTTLLRLMTPLRWQEAILLFKESGKLIFGTCAGMIILARNVIPAQPSLGLIDITVQRNAYGRQLDSHVAWGACDHALFGVDHCEMVFIRAPKIVALGASVKVLATCENTPVLVQEGNVMCASFHPECSSQSVVHQWLVRQLCLNYNRSNSISSSIDSTD